MRFFYVRGESRTREKEEEPGILKDEAQESSGAVDGREKPDFPRQKPSCGSKTTIMNLRPCLTDFGCWGYFFD